MIATEEMSKIGLGTQNLESSTEKTPESNNGEGKKGSVSLEDVYHGGVNTFDTSPISGRGRSELEIGNFVENEQCRENVFLSSKCGYHWDLEDDFRRDTSEARLRQELAGSLNRLKVNVIDLYLLNSPPTGEDLDSCVNALGQMRRDRNIRNIGLKNPSLDQLEQSLEITPIDFVQIPVNVYNEERLERFRPVCERESVRIMGYDILNTGEFFDSTGIPPEEEFASDGSAMALNEMKQRLEDYFQAEYPDEPTERLMASWSVHSPSVHSSLMEIDRIPDVQSILQVLKLQLTQEDYKNIRRIFSVV